MEIGTNRRSLGLVTSARHGRHVQSVASTIRTERVGAWRMSLSESPNFAEDGDDVALDRNQSGERSRAHQWWGTHLGT